MRILASFDMFILRIIFDSSLHSADLLSSFSFGLDAPELWGFLGVQFSYFN